MNFVTKKVFFITPLVLFILNGCGTQSPAPIYGSPQPTNPYADQHTEPPKTIEKNSQPEAVNKRPSDNTKTSDSSFVKKPMSPAVLALVSEAETSSRSGDLESAVVTIERALRIDSRNPVLTYKLAALRLKQSKPRLAEDLAKKAALLSANDKALKKKSWLLISEARRQQKNYHGAKEARLKAEEI
jgi:tetratricopeptide (TPR) repeat protein